MNMKAVLLAGGLGTRISEETHIRPKPMVEVGGKPILWHIMKLYSFYGINNFIICCGYKGYMIKEYFANFRYHINNIRDDLRNEEVLIMGRNQEEWVIELIDTGEMTNTGGRIKRIKDYVGQDFCLTYGDGLSNVNISQLISHHKASRKMVTLTSVKPPGRFGRLSYERGNVVGFSEKEVKEGERINGGFFVLQKDVIDHIEGDDTVWEGYPLEKLADIGQICEYRHDGFWQPMDTLREKILLEQLWGSGNAPWKLWK